MHLYSKAAGLGSIGSKAAMDALLNEIILNAVRQNRIKYVPGNGDELCEAEICEKIFDAGTTFFGGWGYIVIRGLYSPVSKTFTRQFYFPLVVGNVPHSDMKLSMERHNDKEAYYVNCMDDCREIAPIFFLGNIIEFLNMDSDVLAAGRNYVYLGGLCREGKVLLPIYKSQNQIKKLNKERIKRIDLIKSAYNGSQEAMANLTIVDYDIMTKLSKRILTEDVLSVVDTSFLPSGMECDAYSVIGNIIDCTKTTNTITGEELYFLNLECNNVYVSVVVNAKDLYGIPQPGFRFSGRIWLQGIIRQAN